MLVTDLHNPSHFNFMFISCFRSTCGRVEYGYQHLQALLLLFSMQEASKWIFGLESKFLSH